MGKPKREEGRNNTPPLTPNISVAVKLKFNKNLNPETSQGKMKQVYRR